jgi:hypothetical protein
VKAVGVAATVAALLAAGPLERLSAQAIVNDSGGRSVRSAALAGAGVALVGDAASIFANPAGIATIRRGALDGSYEQRAGGTTTLSGAGALRVGRFEWGVGAAAADVQAGGGASDVLALSALVLRFGMLAVGSSLKYVQQDRAGVPLHAWAGDAGVAIAVFDIAALGASVQNISGDFPDGTRLRRWTRVGLTMNYVDPQGALRLLTTFEGQWPEGRSAVLAVGAEGGVVTRGLGVIGRVGATGRAVPGGGSAVTVGAGLELHELRFDYAYQPADAPDGARHRFGLRWAH